MGVTDLIKGIATDPENMFYYTEAMKKSFGLKVIYKEIDKVTSDFSNGRFASSDIPILEPLSCFEFADKTTLWEFSKAYFRRLALTDSSIEVTGINAVNGEYDLDAYEKALKRLKDSGLIFSAKFGERSSGERSSGGGARPVTAYFLSEIARRVLRSRLDVDARNIEFNAVGPSWRVAGCCAAGYCFSKLYQMFPLAQEVKVSTRRITKGTTSVGTFQYPCELHTVYQDKDIYVLWEYFYLTAARVYGAGDMDCQRYSARKIRQIYTCITRRAYKNADASVYVVVVCQDLKDAFLFYKAVLADADCADVLDHVYVTFECLARNASSPVDMLLTPLLTADDSGNTGVRAVKCKLYEPFVDDV